ncbi:MAG: DUF4249 family protein [Ignavibacteria bacterium]|nr:DUF4249 family protein [Ignavibacteria bacterium]
MSIVASKSVVRPAPTMWWRFVACFVLLLPLAGCTDNFDPTAHAPRQLVVFSVLSTDRESQFVRVQTDYIPVGYNPFQHTSDNSVLDAVVTITTPNKVYRLRDTLVWHSDTSRYKFALRTYYANLFTPQRGSNYLVEVSSPTLGQASAAIIVPGQARIALSTETQRVLDYPHEYSLGTPIEIAIQFSKSSKGHMVRFFAWYDVLKGNEWVEEAVEIPISSFDPAPYMLVNPVYPRMGAIPANSQLGIVYRNGYFKGAINIVNERYRTTQIFFKWITVVVLQADENLYKYYVSTHASGDPHSIRLDEPMVSTVNGGTGLVGAYTLDSLVYLLPYDFWGNR